MLNSLGLDSRPQDTRVVVAMSGGVDSSVTAALLAAEGYDVVGVTLQLYDHGEATHRKGACCAGRDIHDARSVAASLVHEAVREEFVALLAAEVEREVRLGDPLEEATTMGPVNNEPGAAKMDAHVADAVERGATVVTGGSRAAGFPTGLYWQPTVLDDVPSDSIAVTHETFGPIAPIVGIDSLEDAIDQTNSQTFGLMAAIFTHDLAAGMRYADSVHMGLVNVNETTNYWEAHLPWGGSARSDSGIGRVGGRYVMDTLTELQTVLLPA